MRRTEHFTCKPGVVDRIWPRLEVGDCWVWGGAKSAGYGVIGWRQDGRSYTRRVHRVVWEHLVGPISDGLHLDHLCRNPPCCNPDHLEPVTARENGLRKPIIVRPLDRAALCGNGHPWSENEWWPTSAAQHPYRRCRACMRGQWSRRNAKMKGVA